MLIHSEPGHTITLLKTFHPYVCYLVTKESAEEKNEEFRCETMKGAIQVYNKLVKELYDARGK